MTRRGPTRARGPAALALAVGLFAAVVAQAGGCAAITTTESTASVVLADPPPAPAPAGPPEDRDRAGRQIVARELELSWQQDGRLLTVQLTERRRCRMIERVAVRETVTITRRAGPALYFEYGLAAALAALATHAYLRPTDYSSATIVDPSGATRPDPAPGFVVAGLFTAAGSIVLGLAVHDSLRARDERRVVDTFTLREGPLVACEPDAVPKVGQLVELRAGGAALWAVSDGEGAAALALPEGLAGAGELVAGEARAAVEIAGGPARE